MSIDLKTIQSNLLHSIKSCQSEETVKILLDSFATNIDDRIQNRLMTDLMLKYAELSKRLEESNQSLARIEEQLQKYNYRLQELVSEKVQEISESQMATIFALVKLSESRDDDTGAHVARTAKLCRLLAQRLGLLPQYKNIITGEYIDNIYRASPLHDIGKVGMPDAILLKPDKLTPEEFEIMKTHTTVGFNTLAQVAQRYAQNAFLKMGMDISRCHHEKWDGNGYPQGLSGEDIPLSARIMALVDVYDALRSKRVYKEAFSHEKSYTIITEGSGGHFDPLLIELFLQIHKDFQATRDAL